MFKSNFALTSQSRFVVDRTSETSTIWHWI